MEPNTLDEWTFETLEEIVLKGIFESERLDFKEFLPDSRNESEKERLYKTCCAFANSTGGFIVFGVVDKKSLTSRKRITGLKSTLDFPEHFGNYPSSCFPSVYWDFKKIPITLQEGKVIHIVHIPESWKSPHAVKNKDGSFLFLKRTNKGNERMSFEEIREAFMNYDEKRRKLQLLRSEVDMLKANAKEAYLERSTDWEWDLKLADFSIGLLESIIGEIYDLISVDSELLRLLKDLRLKAGQIRVRTPLALLWKTSEEKNSLRSHNF